MQQSKFFALGGGLDLVTPKIRMNPGHVLTGINHEPVAGGYARIDGYERYDGHIKPSQASYWLLPFDEGQTVISAGETLTGATSGATGIALYDVTPETGTWAGNDASGDIVLVAVSGTFEDDENLEVSASVVAVANGTAQQRGADNDPDDTIWYRGAIEYHRDQIEAVPGSGPVRGVGLLGGTLYAIRDNAGATEGVLHKATSSGWVAQDLGLEIAFSGAGLREISFTSGGIRTLAFTSGGTTAIEAGNTVQGDNSSATADVVAVVLETGTWAGGDAAGTLYLTNQSGTFVSENLDVGASANLATIAGDTTVQDIAADDEITGETSGATATVQQVIIDSGAWASGDAAGRLICIDQDGNFEAEEISAGTIAGAATIASDSDIVSITEGDTITGETGGATADVTRVVVNSGAFGTNDAAGFLYLTSQTGTFQSETIKTGDQLELATIAGDSTELTLPAGGRYDIVSHNFFGLSDLRRLYGANGVGRAFEWDGSVFVPIRTGLSDALDKPQHIAVHKNQLFLSFAGGSLQHSGIGEPYAWSVLLGAAEIAIGQDVTNLLSLLGILVITAQNKVSVLYGDDSANWSLKDISADSGAIEWTAQDMGASPVFLDDGGIRTLQATDQYGDFRMGTLSYLIDPIFAARRRRGVLPIGSIRLRSKDQYRLYYDDGSAITMYLGGEYPQYLTQRLDHVVRCSCVGEDSSGNEIAFFGSDDGFVYQIDAGTSFDGESVEAFLRLAHNNLGSPYQEKRFHAIGLELDASPLNTIGIIADFGYSDPDRPDVVEEMFEIRGGGGFWSEDYWNEFYWSQPSEGIAHAPIDGMGPNISPVISSDAIYESPYTVTGMTIFYSNRRMIR